MTCINFKESRRTLCCCAQPDETSWWVDCAPESIQRMAEWSGDPVMKNLLPVLRCIPNILVPLDLPAEDADHYYAWPPEGAGTWFGAAELDNLQSLEAHCGITVKDLWTIAASLCETLTQLCSLGIWGYASRDRVLLRKGRKLGYCLTDITDCHIYQYSQTFPFPNDSPVDENETPETLAMRLLVGGVALCADHQQLLSEKETDLELQLGRACVGKLSQLFRTPSQLQPIRFLEDARSALRRAAKSVRLDSPKKIHLYLVLLGTDCRQVAVPALSCVARSFYHCARELGDIRADAVCIYPWDRVCICRFEENCVYGLSALDQDQDQTRRRPVLLGGLLDCLTGELDRDLSQGTASLVCYIALPTPGGRNPPALNCMDHILIEELARKRRLEIFDAFLCSADLQQRADIQYSTLVEEHQHITLKELDSKMYSAMTHLLKKTSCFCPKSSFPT